jgi:threonine dehydrogenase-like Zn-dependent dehydrogenase
MVVDSTGVSALVRQKFDPPLRCQARLDALPAANWTAALPKPGTTGPGCPLKYAARWPPRLSGIHRLKRTDPRDYEEPDFAGDLAAFDCVFDAFGSLSGSTLSSAMKAGATFISTVLTVPRLIRNVITRRSSVHERLVMVRPKRADLEQLGRWLQSGALKPVIDARFSLEDAQRGFQRLESHHARGKVMIEIA